MSTKFKYFILAGVIATSLSLQAAVPTIEAKLTPDSIAIGDTFTYSITVEANKFQVIGFPIWSVENSGTEPVEFISEGAVDTISMEGNRVKLRKEFLLQAFQEGEINLGLAEILYLDKNIADTLRSQEDLVLRVGTFEIDSTSHIFDIKAQKNLPFRFREIRGYVLWSLVGLLLLAAALYLLIRYLNSRGRSLADLFKTPPPPPPHVEAIEALEGLHSQKLWQSSKHKEYYSSITDILRRYIERRYSVAAREMTSDEIMQALRDEDIPQKSSMNLSSLLFDADLVKFAKAQPDGDVNEEAYQKAYYFVEQTKQEQEEDRGEDEVEVKL